MKNTALALILLCSLNVGAVEKFKGEPQRIDIMPLQLQLRYEDANDQTRKMQTYQGLLEFNVAYQFAQYRLSLGHSYFEGDKTGNQTLNIEKSKHEYLLGGGYRFLRITNSDQNVSLEVFANVFAGTTQSETSTNFFGVNSTAKSDTDAVLGAGGSAVGRFFKFLVAEADVKMLYSENMSPQVVPAFSVRVGGSFWF